MLEIILLFYLTHILHDQPSLKKEKMKNAMVFKALHKSAPHDQNSFKVYDFFKSLAMYEGSSSSNSSKLRVIRFQNYHAAIVIQRYYRGHLRRKILWSYNGVIFNNKVLRIQCAWRQHLALNRTREAWFKKVEKSVHIIHSLFYYWKSRRIRKIIKLTYYKNVFIHFQANIRRKLQRKKYIILLFQHKTAKSIIIQSIIRRLIGENATKRRKKLISSLVKTLSSFSLSNYLTLLKNDLSIIISNKACELSTSSSSVNLKENFLSFFLSIVYDLSVNNSFMIALTKLQCLNNYFNKLQYNLISFIKTNKNNFNRLLMQSSSSSSSSSSVSSSSLSLTPSSSLFSTLSQYHYGSFLMQFLNYLTRMVLWTKYNKTRQIHFMFLEQSLGCLACQITLVNYNYDNNSLFSSSANPLSLLSFLLFPKQLLKQSFVSSTSSSSVSATSRKGSSSFSNNPIFQLLTEIVFDGNNQRKEGDTHWLWNQEEDSFSLNEVSAVFYLISSWSSVSFSKLFDSLMFKVDLLLYLVNFSDLFESIQNKRKSVLQPSQTVPSSAMVTETNDNSKNEIVNTVNCNSSISSSRLMEDGSAKLLVNRKGEEEGEEDLNYITNANLYYSTTPNDEDTSLVIHNGLAFYKILSKQDKRREKQRKQEDEGGNEKEDEGEEETKAVEEELLAVNENDITDIKQFRALAAKKKEKKVIAKKEKSKPKSERHRYLYRIWKLLEKARQIVIPGSFDSYELSYRMDFYNSLLQTAHDAYVIRDLMKDFLILIDNNGNSIFPDSPLLYQANGSSNTKNMLTHLKNHQKGGFLSFSLKIHYKMIISGSLMYITGEIISPSTSSSSSKDNEEKTSSSAGDVLSEPILSLKEKETKKANQQNHRYCQTYIYDKIPLFPWPIHPMILFPHEINNIANNYRLFSVNQFSLQNNNTIVDPSAVSSNPSAKKPRISRRLSSNQWLDYEKFAEFILSEVSLVFSNNNNNNNSTSATTSSSNTPPSSSFLSSDCEPILSFYFHEIHQKRKHLLDSNIMKYSAILIQRSFRGFLGRNRFKMIYSQYLIMKRKRYLSYKVFYRLKVMYANHQIAAIQIQRITKGHLLRKEIKKWNYILLKIQCHFRCFLARKRIAEERKRLFDGPQVVLMNKGGKMLEISGQFLSLFIYRCNNQYKFFANNPLTNSTYIGYLYEKQLKKILSNYNSDIIETLNGDITSIYSKALQLNVWQYEKLLLFFYKYLNLLPKIINITNTFNNIRKEEKDFYLAICYQYRGPTDLITAFLPPSSSSSLQLPASITSQALVSSSNDKNTSPSKGWRDNCGNIYSITSNSPEKKKKDDTTDSLLGLLPSTEENRLQKKELPKEFSALPVLDSVKKFKLFKDFNNEKTKKISTVSRKNPGTTSARSPPKSNPLSSASTDKLLK
jgi:hypothetical protein